VFPESYGHIKGELIVAQSANNQFDAALYDHIVEGGLNVESGLIEFLDCPGSFLQLKIAVQPGTYRVRVYFLTWSVTIVMKRKAMIIIE
jgi:hypothetical protein